MYASTDIHRQNICAQIMQMRVRHVAKTHRMRAILLYMYNLYELHRPTLSLFYRTFVPPIIAFAQ